MDTQKHPVPPEYFDEYARGLWERSLNSLEELEALHRIDYDLLAQFCFLQAECHRLAGEIHTESSVTTFINKQGVANKVINPKIRLYRDYMGIVTKLSNEFGFTPNSRKRILGTVKQNKVQSDFDGI